MSTRANKKAKISIKRAYEDASPQDGYRVLVDRIWPRGRTKEELALDQWEKELAPSNDLRKWFGHDPNKWKSFQEKYKHELAAQEKQALLRQLLSDAGDKPITLVYGAKDEEHNQAVVLQEVLTHFKAG